MKKKLCRALGILLSITMLSGEMGSFSVFAAGDEQEVSAEEESGGSETDSVSEDETLSQNETVSDNTTDEDESSSEEEPGSEEDSDSIPDENNDDKEYITIDENAFKVLSSNLEVGSYAATFNLEATKTENKYNSILVIYTTKEDAEFFPDKDYITINDLQNSTDYTYTNSDYGKSQRVEDDTDGKPYTKYSYSVKIAPLGNTAALLSPDTTYYYQVAVGYYDEGNKYAFVTQPQQFTTKAAVNESKVSIGDVTTGDHGYYRSDISVSINNPDNEYIEKVQLVVKSENDASASVISTLDYDKDNNNYTGSYGKTDKELELRAVVYVGEGEKSYVKKDFVQDLYDDKDLKASVSANNSISTNLIVEGELTPYYEKDELTAYLYYKTVSTNSYYKSKSIAVNKDGKFSISPNANDVNPNTVFYYYIELRYSYNSAAVKSFGSKDDPYTFTIGDITNYTESDFKDSGIYALVKKQVGEANVNNAKLSELKSLSISNYGYDKEFVIESLADLPEKMPNLTSVSFYSQNITDISPLLELKYLKTVSLNYNDVSVLPDLSGVKWERFDLNNNPISEEAVIAAKIPESVSFSWSTRKDDFIVADTYYIDANEVFPIIVKFTGYKDIRNYTVTISMNNINKSYEGFSSAYEKTLVISTAKEDFALEQGKEYAVKITLNDGYSDIISLDKTWSFVPMSFEIEDYYIGPWTDSFGVDIYFPGMNYNSASFNGIRVVKDDKAYYSTNSLPYGYSMDMCEKLYYDVFQTSYLKGLDYSCLYMSNAYLYVARIPEKGDYDLVLEPKEGEKYVWKNKIHVTDYALVEDISYNSLGYDNSGEYYYIRLNGFNLDKENGFPVICDDKGGEYTTVNDVIRTSDKGYVYQLKKNDNWAEINKAPEETDYIVKIVGEKVIDQRNDYNKTIKAIYLKDKEGINLKPVTAYYNWKKQTFEYTFNSTVKEGTEINLEFFTDSSVKDITATATGKTDNKGIVSLKPINSEGAAYIPENGFQQYYRVKSGDAVFEGNFMIKWYNWSENYSGPVNNDRLYAWVTDSFLIAPAADIEVHMEATPNKHSTNKLVARIIGTEEKKELKYTKENSYDRFDSGKWTFSKPLPAGNYTVEVYEVVSGEEVSLYTCDFYVKEKGVFYTDNNWQSFYYNDLSAANAYISMPFEDVPATDKESDLKAFVEKIKLKVEVFDADYKLVNGLTITPTRASGKSLYFDIKGLDEDALCYYVRFTKDGKTPLRIYDDTEYYNDPVHGNKLSRSSGFGLSGSTDYYAYYYVYTYELKNQLPLTLNFYEFSDQSRLVQSLTVKKENIDNNYYYYFTKDDVAKLDPSTVYTCFVISNNQRVSSQTGYFASRDNGKADNPYTITLKANKKETISATLKLNTNGADPMTAYYTKAKNEKSAKMAKLTKKGHTFKGWYVYYTVKGKVKKKKVTSITASIIKKYAEGGAGGTLALNAEFTANTYTVKYNKTGKFEGKKVKTSGKIKSEKLKYSSDLAITVKGGELTLKDSTLELKGWTTVKNGTEVLFEVGENVNLTTILPAKGKTITLYAVYGKKE